ncbi:hypothetical protein L3i20_v235130 [Paenibacillus sp. L3-i20]|nr:hypothetical protein L3i20_v235130 [Paenibacillus sp. L3-i20]
MKNLRILSILFFIMGSSIIIRSIVLELGFSNSLLAIPFGYLGFLFAYRAKSNILCALNLFIIVGYFTILIAFI